MLSPNMLMQTTEIVIWAAMGGAWLMLTTVAAIDAARTMSLPAWRGVSFLVLIGVSAMLLTGLPEHLLGVADERAMLPAKMVLGPVTGAVALNYLSIWLGLTTDDKGMGRVLFATSLLAALAGIALLAVHVTVSPWSVYQGLALSLLFTLLPLVVAALVSVRIALLGDNLAWGMVTACLCMVVMVAGLYAKGLHQQLGDIVWALIAVATVTNFVLITALTILRNLAQKRLQRIARDNTAYDLVTGLPIGSVLLSKVEDAIWRGARVGNDSAVMAIWVDNLYALHDRASPEIEQELRTRITAIVRQCVGFRNVVGLMQARCYMVAFSSVQDKLLLLRIAQRVLSVAHKPMRLGVLIGNAYVHVPQVSVGIMHVPRTEHDQSLVVMDAAQRLAQQAAQVPGRLLVK
jgi:GGDEF domain-containing protein